MIVLLRQKKTNKLSTRFENQKGNSVTIKSEGEAKVRNSREVKLFLVENGDDGTSRYERKLDEISKESEGRKGDIYPSKMDELDDIEVEQAAEEQAAEESMWEQSNQEESKGVDHCELDGDHYRGPGFCFRLKWG